MPGPIGERHAAIGIAAQASAAEARESGARRVQVAELFVVEIRALRGNGVGIVVALHAGAQVQQQGRRQRAGRNSRGTSCCGCSGSAHLRDRFGQAVHAVRLIRVLQRIVARDLGLLAEAVVDLDGGDLPAASRTRRRRRSCSPGCRRYWASGSSDRIFTETGSNRFCGMTLLGNTFSTRRPLESIVAVSGS